MKNKSYRVGTWLSRSLEKDHAKLGQVVRVGVMSMMLVIPRTNNEL